MSRPGGEPTEEPTPRRLADARRRGEIAYSGDLVAAAALAAAVAALAIRGAAGADRLIAYTRQALRAAPSGAPLGAAARRAAAVALDAAGAPVAAAFVAAAVVALLQTRGLVSIDRLRPDPRRLSPARALRHALDGGAAARTLAGLAKVLFVAAVVWLAARPLAAPVIALAGAQAPRLLAALGAMARRIAIAAAAATMLAGAADYLAARARHRRALRMTRDEVRRERKETEGDPDRRAQQRRLRRELLAAPETSRIAGAALIVTGDGPVAVALRYQAGGPTAPVVVARGERLAAAAIERAAREAGVPIARDDAVARALGDVAAGDEIPAALFEPVAALLKPIIKPIIYRRPVG